MPYYTTSTAVGALLGTTFSSATNPTYETVATFIAWASDEIKEATGRAWSLESVTNEVHDAVYTDSPYDVFTVNTPIVTVSTFEVNEGSATSPSWSAKTETTDYILYDDHVKYVTYYDWLGTLSPSPIRDTYGGLNAYRISYDHGSNTTPADITRAATLKAAMDVLSAQMSAAAGSGLKEFSVGQAKYKYGDLSSVILAYQTQYDSIIEKRSREDIDIVVL